MAPLVRRNTTYARVSFFTFKAPGRVDAYDEIADALTSIGGVPTQAVQTSLVSWSYTKNLGEAAAQVEITLKGHKVAGNPFLVGKPWPDLVEEGDWWMIDTVKNGVLQGLSFGKIDLVNLGIRTGPTGAGEVVVTIVGRDFGFVLEDTPVYFNPYDSSQDNALGIHMKEIIGTANGNPAQVIVNVIKGFMGGGKATVLGGHVRVPILLGGPRGSPLPTDPRGEIWSNFVDFDTCVQKKLRGRVATPTMFGVSGSNSVWTFLQAWRNPVLNEMYMDIVPRYGIPKQGCLVVREKPFVNAAQASLSPWFNLRSWYIDASVIQSLALSRGANRKNHFHLLGDMVSGLSEDSYAIFSPVTNFEDIQKYGLHRLQENTRYYDDTKTTGAAIESNDWLNLIASWNVLNHLYWQGTINVGEMLAEIRVGQKLFVVNGPPAGYEALPNDRVLRIIPGNEALANQASLSFYVEGVKHTYVQGEQPRAYSSFTVSRGFREGERIGAVTGAVAKLSSTGVIAIPAAVLAGTGSRNAGQQDPTDDITAKTIDSSKANEDYQVQSTETSI